MTSEVMTDQTVTHRPAAESEPTVKMIIAAARSTPQRAPARGALLVSGLTGLLLWASFMPLDWGPLAWLALVPMLLLVRIPEPTRRMYRAVFAGGLLFTVPALQWLRLADPSMYAAWILLAVYIALYFPAFVWLCRAAVHRFGVPLTLTVPVVWTALEYARAHLMTGFPWYFLGHTQYRWIEIIQVSDLTGAYGVSFVVALTSACLAGLVPGSVFSRLRLLPPDVQWKGISGRRQLVGVAACLTVFLAVCVYGYVRRAQAEFVEGPRVALVQGNFPTSMKRDPRAARSILNTHEALTGMAVRKHHLDLIVWPETMYRAPLLITSSDVSDETLQRFSPPGLEPHHWRESAVVEAMGYFSRKAGAATMIGLETWTIDRAGFRRYNSAAFARPDTGYVGRYDKLHRVIFGEYVPLVDQFPWLARLTPITVHLAAGDSAQVFEYAGYRFAPLICFEDTVPSLARSIAKSASQPRSDSLPQGAVESASGRTADTGVDCFVNLTNDGWFHGSAELDQHLITALFRAVECRTPMVRAVNTGISAVIDGDGVVVEPDDFIDADNQARRSMRDPRTGRWHKQLAAVIVDAVPLDNRRSLYVAWGDWFAGSCAFLTGMLLVGGLIPRRRSKSASRPA